MIPLATTSDMERRYAQTQTQTPRVTPRGGPAFIPAESIYTPLSLGDLRDLGSGPYIWRAGEGWRGSGWVRCLGMPVP